MSGSQVLGLVAARGGSVGVPRKNVLPLCGKPLIVHTIEAALAAGTLTRTILSSDDAEIIAVARGAGCEAPFVRPADLAGDRSSTVDVALHALDWLEGHEGWRADVVVLLPATAPLRRAEHIDGVVAHLVGHVTASAVIAVTEADYPPYWMLSIDEGRLRWIFPEGGRVDHRQELPKAYRPNGSIYAIKVPALRAERTFYPRESVPFLMASEDSVNIDAPMDFRLAEVLIRDRMS
ncbi:MAG: cytidylyltransferase domain-containing protein [Candidatus Rokuibacteriota bacterium]